MITRRCSTPVIALVLLAALCSTLRAGVFDVHFGARAGVNLATAIYDPPIKFADDETIENDYRTVFGGGGVVSLTFTDLDLVSLESGLLLQMKGGKTINRFTTEELTIHDPEPVEVKMDIRWKLLSLTVPLRARVSVRRTGIVPYVKAGLDFDILLSARHRIITTYSCTRIEEESDIRNSAAVDVGLVGGAGVALPAGRVRLFIEAEYCHGVRNVLEPDDPDFEFKLHNRVIGVMAGVLF